MVKRLRKSVQYVRRYSMKYACFLAVSYQTFSNELHYLWSYLAEVHQIFHDKATSSPLLKRTFRLWNCNSYWNDSAKNASGISRRLWHFTKINWLPWQLPSTNSKTRYRYINCTQSAFIWWKDCKNRSSISWDIWLNMPVFCDVVKKSIQMSPVFSGMFTKF